MNAVFKKTLTIATVLSVFALATIQGASAQQIHVNDTASFGSAGSINCAGLGGCTIYAIDGGTEIDTGSGESFFLTDGGDLEGAP